MVQTVEKIEVREERPVELDEPSRSEGEVEFPELDEMGKVLLKARDTLREWGWFQNHYLDVDSKACEFPRVCMLGAVNQALGRPVGEEGWTRPNGKRQAVRRLGFKDAYEAVCWNDTTDRTQQEVEERLERAAYNL